MWEFISKVYDGKDGGLVLFVCFIILVMVIQKIVVTAVKRVKTPRC